jgi:hypothetical protein
MISLAYELGKWRVIWLNLPLNQGILLLLN